MLNIYPPSAFDVYKKIKIHYSPSIDAACDEIYKACEGVGTDEKTIVKVLGPRSPNDRALIAYRYQELYNTSLRDLVKSETSGDFGYALQLISMSLPRAEAYIIYHAMKGLGTSEQLIYPIVLGRTNEELSILKKAFFEMYETDLSVMANDDLSGDFHYIITTALQEVLVEHKSSFHTREKAEEDAERIYKAGEGKWGTDEGGFVKTLLASPPKHIRHIDEIYTEKYKHGLVYAIESEFSGTSAQALSFYVRLALDPWNTVSELIENAMNGIGTDESALSAALVRYHPYLHKVKHSFEHKNKLSLRERVHEETTGRYQELLMYIIDAPVSIGEYA
jgi:hypothetical protein|uniref:Annexin n=1 Tax=Globisporangium ultimum (strain ATCC 200006 / CBS 805.95 / DAOM BR144) TaxID=431595 RepID=K3WZ30_GLOUD